MESPQHHPSAPSWNPVVWLERLCASGEVEIEGLYEDDGFGVSSGQTCLVMTSKRKSGCWREPTFSAVDFAESFEVKVFYGVGDLGQDRGNVDCLSEFS